jgi:Putative bacterial sensory transduction regulator
MSVTEKHFKADDLYLEMVMKGNPMPQYKYLIDTQVLNNEGDKIIERGIRLQLFTQVKVSAAERDPVIRIIDDFNRRKVFSAAYIDTDGEIVVDWTLNILPCGLDMEYVWDALVREDKLWHELYSELAPTLH